jgi:predicted lysophospholipase L1 biosynthesis ABC-type transport system permease subunit
VLTGLTALLPWVVEAIVRRAPDGPLPWLLAIRRLRGDAGTTGRVVGAIGLAVAGAIALQILFGAAETRDRDNAAPPPDRGAQLVTLAARSDDGAAAVVARLRATPGATGAFGAATVTAPDGFDAATVAPCSTLTRVIATSDCRAGDSFVVREPGSGLHPGGRLRVAPHFAIDIPRDARIADAVTGAPELSTQQLLFTPGAARRLHLRASAVTVVVRLAPGDRAAADRLRDRAAALDPEAEVSTIASSGTDHALASLRRALFAGAVAVLAMIGASLLVAAGEQLRERRRALAVLAAVGTRRSTMAWSMLWQAAIPVGSGLALAIALGIALGNVLTAIVSLSPSYDWGAIALMVGAGAAIIAAVTLLTLPTLWRMMRPETLRVE